MKKCLNSLKQNMFFLFKTALIIAVFLSAFFQANAKTEMKETANETALHLTKNEELIKAAKTLLQKASRNFLSQLREVQRRRMNFEEMKAKSESTEIPGEEAPEPDKKTDALNTVKMKLDYAITRADALKELKEQIEAAQMNLSAYRDQVTATQASSQALNKTYERIINSYLLEFDLRINDGTLKIEDIPDELKSESMNARKQDFAGKQGELDEVSWAINDEKYAMTIWLKEINKKIITAESQITSFENSYDTELRRQNIEKELSTLDTDRLLIEFSAVKKEFEDLKKDFDLSKKKFQNSMEKAEAARKKLEGLEVPDADKVSLTNTISRCEEAEQAIEAIEAVMNYQNRQAEFLEEVRSAVRLPIEYADLLEKDAPLLMGNLLRFQLVSGIIVTRARQGELSSDILSEEYRPESLGAQRDNLRKILSQVLTIKEQGKEEMVQIADRIRQFEPSQKEMEKKLAYLKKVYLSVTRILEWENHLKETPVRKIAGEFSKIKADSDNKLIELEKTRKEYKNEQTAFNNARHKYESLQDPLLQKVKADISDEKQNILKNLYMFAGIEFSEKKTKQPGNTEPDGREKPRHAAQSEKEDLLVDLESYQVLMSTQFELIDRRNKYRAKLSEILTKLEKSIDEYISDLIEAYLISRKQEKAANALRHGFTQKKLTDSDLPPDYAEILKSDQVSVLETEIIRFFNNALGKQLSVQQLLTNLMRPDETLDSIYKLTAQTAGFVGKKFDILKEYKNIKHGMAKKREHANETARKAFEQKAVRRLSDEDTATEYLLGLLPSGRPESLIELMKAYYRELIELEKKKKNTEEMRDKIYQLIQLSREELSVTEKLIPLMKKHILHLENRYAEQWAKIQIRLNPEKLYEILKKFESERGYRFSIPTPVPEEKKAEFIQDAANQIFNRKAEIAAAKEESDIFKQRLSADINKEIDIYTNETDLITIKQANIQRRMRFISGYSEEDLEKLSSEDIPEKELERRRFLKGEMGMLRADRMKLHQKEWTKLIVKLFVILVLAVISNLLISRFMNTLKNQTEKHGKSTSQTLVLYSLFRTVSKFMIWVIAIVMAMYSMGINVAAILTGLGIGGLAIAMASKETISDFIGGVTILMNRPFKVGDRIKYSGRNAAIEDIGLRYTRLRQMPSNNLVVMPNSRLTSAEVVNVSEALRDGIREETSVPLSIRNTSDKLRLACELVTGIIEAHSNTRLFWLKIGSFDNYAYKLNFRYGILGMKQPGGRHKVISEVNTEIIRQFEAKNIEFAVHPHMVLSENQEIPKK
ncbi:mechanosensitive ion channel [Desulfococcaceae bacterium HSG8]|nr:mechanosensitive ion channel [Desulfococcaceae bacterium HSG8]